MKTLKYLFVGFIALGIILSAGAQAAVRNVPDDYATIREAIDAAAPEGDTILIQAGTYVENLFVRKSLTLQGAEAPHITVSTDEVTGKALREWPVKIKGYIRVRDCDFFNMYDLSVDTEGATRNWGSAIYFRDARPKAADAIDVDLKDVELIANNGGFSSRTSLLGNVSVTDCYIRTEGAGAPDTGTWGFGIVGLAAEGQITIERSTLKSSIPIFLTGWFGATFNGHIFCSDSDLVSIGYTGHNSSYGVLMVWGWEEDTSASGSFNDVRIYMNAPPLAGSFSAGINLGLSRLDQIGTHGYNAHDITIDDLNISVVGEADYGVALEGTAHDNTIEDINLQNFTARKAHIFCDSDTYGNAFSEISFPDGTLNEKRVQDLGPPEGKPPNTFTDVLE
jgi:hypothetical protein